MPKKIKSYENPIKPVIQKYLEGKEKNRFVFTVDPQCIVTVPIDHCLYVCDICSLLLKTEDSFKKHYIKLHINHAHATLSDLKFSGDFPINLSNFKEDDGCFRCHYCIGSYFSEKSDLKDHLNLHDSLQELTNKYSPVSEDSIQSQYMDSGENNGESVTNKMTPCNHPEDSEMSIPLLPLKQVVEPVILMTLNDIISLPNSNLPTSSRCLNSLPESLVTLPPVCNIDEAQIEPLSSVLGVSLLTLFNTPPNVLPDLLSSCVESTSSALPGRSCSPIFAQDCTTSNETFIDLSKLSCPVEPVSTFQSTSDYVSMLSSDLTLPTRSKADSPISRITDFSSASTEDISQYTTNDTSDKLEECLSSLTTSKSDSGEEITTFSKNMLDININNIVLSCLFCDGMITSVKSTETDMMKAHKSRRKHWECVFCKTNFHNCDNLLNHLCSNHSDIFFACISCKVCFSSKAFMDTHFQNKHNVENITKYVSKLSESQNKDDLLNQLKCILYYTNQNIIYNSLSKKIKLLVFNKLSPSSKRCNKQMSDKSVQVLKDNLPLECQTKSSQALNYIGSILKRKLTKDQSKLSNSSQNKIVKLNKDFGELEIENKYQTMLPMSLSDIPPSMESIQEVVVNKSLPVVDNFLLEQDNALKCHLKTDVKLLELDPLNRHMTIMCLFCSKLSFSVKSNNTHVARIHKMRRGGKYCSYCANNFKTLDMLFSHLCSKHNNVYFACVICRERFDSKPSLFMHFDTKHDSVDINKGSFNENIGETPSDHGKELFMFGLKCLPNYPFKSKCSTDCSMCQSPNDEIVLQGLAMNIKISNNTLPCQLEEKLTNNKTKQNHSKIVVNVKYPSLIGDTQYRCEPQNQIKYQFCKPNQQDTEYESMSKSSLIFGRTENKPIVETIRSAAKITEFNLRHSNVEDSVKRLVYTETSNLDTVAIKNSPITSRSDENISSTLSCLFCDKIFVKAKAYRVHLYRAHKAKKNKCMFCNIDFNYYEDLFDHLLLSHNDVYIACNICRIRFSASSLLIEHENNVHKPTQAKESNHIVADVPILTEEILHTTKPKCVPEVVYDLPCLESIEDNKSPLVELGLQLIENDSKDESNTEISKNSTRSNGHQLIKFSHPQYENIAMRNYAYLDIIVQLQILARVKDFTAGKQHTKKYPYERPQKQQKSFGTVGKREFSGEWARSKNYFCANCGSHFVNFWDFDVHRWNTHPNVSCSVFDFYVEDTPPCYFEEGSWPYNRLPSQATVLVNMSAQLLNVCSKCGRSCVNSSSFHKHLISCSQHNKLTFKSKRSVSWKEPDKMIKRRRRSCRGLKSILDTPPKLPPTPVFNTNKKNSQSRMKTTNGVPKRLLSDKTNRRLSFNLNENAHTLPFADNKHEIMLTRSRSVISNIDEKTKELIEKFERGKYNYIESFTRRLTKPLPKNCS